MDLILHTRCLRYILKTKFSVNDFAIYYRLDGIDNETVRRMFPLQHRTAIRNEWQPDY